jgi:hypothetical protein
MPLLSKAAMKIYDTATFTYGYELEMSDVPKGFPVPPNLGKWEWCELDIVNTLPPYRGVCCDPRGVDPPVGGEINTVPTVGWQAQMARVLEIIGLFTAAGFPPTFSCSTCNHPHVHVPGLLDDIDALRRLTTYVYQNQADAVRYIWAFREMPDMKLAPTKAVTWMKFIGGSLMPDWVYRNLMQARTPQEWADARLLSKKGVREIHRVYRYAINLFALLYDSRTVEFRIFRGSGEPRHLASMFAFTEQFMDAALNGGPSVYAILFERGNRFEFPPFVWDLELMTGWANTIKTYEPSRSGKAREFWNAT